MERPLEDWEDPEPDLDEDEESELYACPQCGADVYEDCEQCPQCGDYIKPVVRGTSGGLAPWMKVVLVLLIVALSSTILLLR